MKNKKTYRAHLTAQRGATFPERLKSLFPASVPDTLLSIVILGAATGVCFLLRLVDTSNIYVSVLFVLAVFLIARFTQGYLYGIAASFASILVVNYIFTYPFFAFNFTLPGYPITIGSALVVSIITGMLTTRIKEQERMRYAIEQEKNRSNLLRAISHDLRTPLTSILGANLAIMENDEKFTRQERMQLLQSVNEDAEWLIRVVENLLTITRMDSGSGARITMEPEAVEELVAETVAKFRKRFPDKAVQASVPEELLLVPMDVVLIGQVLTNLLENAALHAQGATWIRLEVSCRELEAVFTVSDNGQGINPAIMEHIFDGAYLRDDRQEPDGKRNMGIGLSVCDTIIRAHSGTMSAGNRPEGGAWFSFTLPLNEREEA